MDDFRLGMLLWSQATTWGEIERAARRVDDLGYDHLWFWDHLYAINTRDPYLPIFEGWTTIAALAQVTTRVGLGLLVGANGFRNPGLVAKSATTVDHISGGRVMVGLGAGWFGLEHHAFGIDFGSGFGERLDRLDESAMAVRRLLAGEPMTSAPGDHYRFSDARVAPAPLQSRVPVMIGGGGERKTLRTVARSADMWNVFGDAARLRHKDAILREHCRVVGRDSDEIERTVSAKMVIRDTPEEARRVWAAQMVNNRCPEEDWDDATELWLGPPSLIAEEIRQRRAVGFDTLIAMVAAPYDAETIDRLALEVRPIVAAG